MPNPPTQIEATTKDGRAIILLSDGTWKYKEAQKESSAKQVDEYYSGKTEQQNELVKIPEKPKQFPPYFKGDSLDDITTFVSTIKDKLAKSEFETESEYKIRLKKYVQETNFVDSAKKLDEIVLVAIPSAYYDAEMKCFFMMPFMFKYENSSQETINIVDRKTGIFPRFSEKRDSLQLHMSAEKAKTIKESLQLAIYGFPVVKDGIYSDSTLFFVPSKYVFFNSETGEIYGTQDTPNFLK